MVSGLFHEIEMKLGQITNVLSSTSSIDSITQYCKGKQELAFMGISLAIMVIF